MHHSPKAIHSPKTIVYCCLSFSLVTVNESKKALDRCQVLQDSSAIMSLGIETSVEQLQAISSKLATSSQRKHIHACVTKSE